MAINKSALRTLDQHVEQKAAPPEQPGQDPVMQAETAAYIFNMTTELVQMVRTSKLDLLAYFLDMARIEAGSLRRIE